MTLKDKVVAITGASSGIGRATAMLLASEGAFVVLGARRAPMLERLVDEITSAGGQATFSPTDVRRRADVQALVDKAVAQTGRLDVMINNAGIGPISRFDALRVDDWDAMIDVNLRGTLYGIAAAMPVFARQDSGHIVNVVSTAGLKMVPTMGVYAATKNAIRTATEVLRQEAGPHLRVSEISPGMIGTNFGDSITDAPTREHIRESVGAIGISPDAIARGILFALTQPPEVDVGSIVIRPTAQA
ncbi:SDR family oxidoreductase [Pseudooceanicola sediminis]|uniref:SDR family oxidoreductase n=1 Tax=Pseudooceanicola sediminis TaxID=2211117 RepID=A0A399J1R1_9RHOB|nr:SDR family oxidoreductase [Pseudooceanicola sediminis]KAA2316352.1 SDR family oxidoreductase [Puniceibacterium sp. HSS470]RII39265.1 SDR family oxidoreductase [Pseudooceanicola sediminis]